MEEITTDASPSINHDFKDTITIGEKLTREQAIAKLTAFHTRSSEQAVLNAFVNLQAIHEGGTVVFADSISKGAYCLKIERHDKDGIWLSTSLIDEHTGQPIAHSS